MPTIKIDPVNRIEGHMGIEVDIGGWSEGTATVTSARAKAMMYRGFENILYKRPAQDVIQITQRI